MGIDGFHKWIETTYPEVYHDINTTKEVYHHLYIDLNYLLHLCHYNSNNEVHLINKMSVTILDICTRVQPVISLNLYCDGTAPFAKMILQRERRCKNIQISDDIFKTSLNFTPGTYFIKEIPNKLSKVIKIIKNQFNIKVNIDSIDAGEAEIKIKSKLLDYYNINNNHKHMLVTNDADVVLILCSSKSYNRSYILLRDKVLSITKLINSHFDKLKIKDKNNLDFVFVNMFLGNDYLPKINQLSPAKLWEAYKLNISDENRCLINIDNSSGINKFNINKKLLVGILNDCVSKIGKTKIIKNNELYNNNKYDNYFDGVLWTLDMYNIGVCNNYNYICNTTKPIDILNLILYLESKQDINNFKYVINPPIPSILCGILLLPHDAQELIDRRYISFMSEDEIKKIYDSKFEISIEYMNNILKKFITYEKSIDTQT